MLCLILSMNKYAIRLAVPPAYTASQLMQLSKTETFCILNHHDRSIWHIHPNFYHRSGNQNLNTIFCKGFHNPILFFWFHLPVKHLHTDIRRQFLSKLLGIICNIFRLKPLTFFHHRADYINLMSLSYLLFDETVSFRAITGIHHTILNRKPPGRKFIHNRNIKIPIENNTERTGNRCGTHNQYIRFYSLG